MEYYLPKMHNLQRVPAVALRYTYVHFPPGHLVHDIHIKEYTVEVIKQILHQCTIPTS